MLALLAFLARHPGRVHRRERLADLLWGASSAAAARQSLRQALADLREVLGPSLIADADTVTLPPGTVSVDLSRFDEEARAGRWAAAVERWQGDFLPGLEDLGSEAWRDWVEQERAGLARAGRPALEQLLREAESREEWQRALQLARRWLTLMPEDASALAAEARLLPLAGRVEQTRDIRGLATPALVGRERELARLEAAWRRVRQGEGRVVVVEGEPGHGTTRLLGEFTRAARASGDEVTVLVGRGYAGEKEQSHSLTRALLLRMLSAPGLAAAPAAVLACLRSVAPELAERFANLPGAEAGYTVASAMHRALAEVAAESPVLVAIDDAPTTDPASLEVLRHLVRHPPAGCLIILGGRPDGWAAVAGEADLRQAAGHLERMALTGLDEGQVADLIRSVAAFEEATAARLAGQIREEIGGAPGDAVEVLHLLVERGALSMDAAGTWVMTGTEASPLPLPPGLEERVRARLARLADVARRLLEAAAVLGEPVTPALIGAVAGLEHSTAAEAIAELLSRRWLRSPPSESDVLAFVDEGTRRVVYRGLSVERRRELHRAAVTALGSADLPPPVREARIARHRQAAATDRWMRPVAAVAVVMMLVLAAVLLVRWTRPAFQGNTVRILLADVADRTTDGGFGRSLAVAATVALRESGRIQVFPRDQVRATLARMGRPGSDSLLTLPLAQEVAERENLDAVLVVEIADAVPGFVIRGRLIAPASGSTLAEATGSAASPDAAVEALDEVLATLRRAAGESRRTTGARRRLTLATTSSLEALRAYADGRRAWQALDSRAALLHWQRAVELDSNFAMALLALSDWSYWNNDRANGEAFLRRALALANRLTERERLSLRATEATRLGTPEEAAARLAVLAESYPDRENWTNLASRLMRQERCRDAIPAARRALGFDSLYATAWITVATCFQLLDRPDSALEAYARAEAAQPGVLYRGSLNQEWGRAFVQAGDLAHAESVFARMAARDDPGDRAFGTRSLGFLAMVRGRYREAAGHFLEASVQSRVRDAKVSELRNRILLAEVLLTIGERAGANQALGRAVELMEEQAMEPGYHLFLGHALVRAGRHREAAALLEAVRGRVVAANAQDRSAERLLTAWVELARGRPEAGLAAAMEDRYAPYAAYRHALRADAFDRLGQVDSGLAAARALAAGYHFGYDSEDEWLRGLLRVGRLAAAVGDTAEARRALSAYLERWREGDSDLPEVRWAREELGRLGREK